MECCSAPKRAEVLCRLPHGLTMKERSHKGHMIKTHLYEMFRIHKHMERWVADRVGSKEVGSDCWWTWGFLRGHWKCSKISQAWQLPCKRNTLKKPWTCTLNECLLLYVNYISIKFFFKQDGAWCIVKCSSVAQDKTVIRIMIMNDTNGALWPLQH